MGSPEAALGLDVTVEAFAASGVAATAALLPTSADHPAPAALPRARACPASTATRAGPRSLRRRQAPRRRRHGGGVPRARRLARSRGGDQDPPDELALKTEAQERFIREAQAQARLSSPNVVQIYFIGRVPAEIAPSPALPEGAAHGSLYFAMELAPGGSLEALLERGERLQPEDARRQMIQVTRGLRDAYAEGIVHRDIKPGNLLLGRDGAVKIADFGLAKPRDPNLGLTRDGAVLGTPLYMAPEQAMGEPLDHRADMYALGATFYHLLTGSTPFDAPNAVAMIARHLTAPPPRVRERAPSVPPRLAHIVERLMAKDRAARYATYDDLLAALDAAAPERIEPAGFWTRAAAAGSISPWPRC